MIPIEQSLRKRPYARIKLALRTAQAKGDIGRASIFQAELDRRGASRRGVTPLTPMAPIPELDPGVEQWLPVPVAEFADRYEISSFGRLRNQDGKILSTPMRRARATS